MYFKIVQSKFIEFCQIAKHYAGCWREGEKDTFLCSQGVHLPSTAVREQYSAAQHLKKKTNLSGCGKDFSDGESHSKQNVVTCLFSRKKRKHPYFYAILPNQQVTDSFQTNVSQKVERSSFFFLNKSLRLFQRL